jgi:hypothetical protein
VENKRQRAARQHQLCGTHMMSIEKLHKPNPHSCCELPGTPHNDTNNQCVACAVGLPFVP